VRVRVESSRCQGHTLCAMIAPASFDLDDVDGHARAVQERVPEEHEGQVQEAVHSCPEQAILLLSEYDGALGAASTQKGTPL
jgi:ferredoxin